MNEPVHEIKMNKFLAALPGAHKSLTFWARRPDRVPAKVRRASDVYIEIALRARSDQLATAPMWEKVAGIMLDAAERMEAVFAGQAG